MNKNFSRGFTLIEITVTTAILIFVLGSSIYTSISFYQRQVLNTFVAELTNTLSHARSLAIYHNNSSYGVRLSTASYTLFKGASFDTRDATFDLVYPVADSVGLVGPPEIVFEQRSGYLVGVSTVTLIANLELASRRITINQAGFISSQ